MDEGMDEQEANLVSAPVAAPPELPYWARWRSPLTAIGMIEIAMKMIAERPAPFVWVTVMVIGVDTFEHVTKLLFFAPGAGESMAFIDFFLNPSHIPAWLLEPLGDAAITIVAARLFYGDSTSVGDVTRSVRPRFLKMFLASSLVRLVSLFGLWLFIVPSVFIFGRVSFILPYVLLEDVSIRQAFIRSWKETRPVQWMLVRLSLFYIVIQLGITITFQQADAAFFPGGVEWFDSFVSPFLIAPVDMIFSLATCWLFFEQRTGWLTRGEMQNASGFDNPGKEKPASSNNGI